MTQTERERQTEIDRGTMCLPTCVHVCTDQSCAWLLASCGGRGLARRDTWIQTASYRSFLLVWTVQGTIRGMPNRLGRFFWDERKYSSERI